MPDRFPGKVVNTRYAQRRSGFTLIELLVVIAIISILASMMFPTFSRARESARRIVCISNMKQIGLGIMQYTQDYDERYPIGYPFWHDDDPETPGIQPPPQDKLLVYVANPYIKSTQIWDCPSWKGIYTTNSTFIGNYSFITNDNNLIGVPDTLPPSSLAGTNNPTDYPLLFCGGHKTQMASPDGPYGTTQAHSGITDEAWNGGKIGGLSVLYADGHAKYSPMTESRWDDLYMNPGL